MTNVSEIRFAKSGDLTIAYAEAGTGPAVVLVPGFISHIELIWDTPFFARLRERLSRVCRLTTFDKRGTGLSDRTLGFGTLEERMGDVRAVMDAAGIERASLIGISEGGPLAVFFAATYPERTDKLVLYGTFARLTEDVGYAGFSTADATRFIEELCRRWGSGEALMPFAQHAPDRETERAMLAKVERYTATPALVSQIMWNNFAIDVRPILGLVRAPTLVAHCVDDPMVSVEFGRYLAENVPGAVYRELPGDFHVSWLVEHADMVVDAIEEFLFGAVAAPEPTERILTTVMFTDIVDSTPLARELGDARWRELLDRHDAIGREEIGRHRGREVKATGDGFLASFDGPARAVRCAQAIARRVRELGLRVRAGVHTGECELRGEDLSGIAVHVGARVAALADPNEVLATRTVRDLVAGSGIVFEDRGEHVLKGLGDPVSVFAAVPESRLL